MKFVACVLAPLAAGPALAEAPEIGHINGSISIDAAQPATYGLSMERSRSVIAPQSER
jgi:hypothetical protein